MKKIILGLALTLGVLMGVQANEGGMAWDKWCMFSWL